MYQAIPWSMRVVKSWGSDWKLDNELCKLPCVFGLLSAEATTGNPTAEDTKRKAFKSAACPGVDCGPRAMIALQEREIEREIERERERYSQQDPRPSTINRQI